MDTNYGQRGWSKDSTSLHEAAVSDLSKVYAEAATEAVQKDGYWGGVVPPAKDQELLRTKEPNPNLIGIEKPLVGNTVVNEEDIEVKYVPNRAQRRAREQALKRSVRRGQRAYDRKIAEMEKSMSPEQIERARELARKAIGNG